MLTGAVDDVCRMFAGAAGAGMWSIEGPPVSNVPALRGIYKEERRGERKGPLPAYAAPKPP
jgi:hypothetical protein